MKYKIINSLLALLLMGSASLMAQGNDPFGEFNPGDYYGNMTVTAKVVMDGKTLTENVVLAVYSGNDLRGKATPSVV